MRICPTKLLHGLLYTAPVIFLTLASCGGGGGSTPSSSLASAYILSVNVTGVSGVGVVLRNNGGNDLTVTTPGTYPFTTAVVAGSGYDVTVLSNPSSPVQVCTVTSAMPATMPASDVTVGVNCVAAYTIGGTITGAFTGTGPILQNNGGDDLYIPSLVAAIGVPFTFTIPVANSSAYSVAQLSRAKSPGQNCSNITAASGVVGTTNVTNVMIMCVAANTIPKYAYVTNSTDNTVSAYTINNAASGVLSTTGTPQPTGSQPYSVSVDPTGRFAYVANLSSNNISAYKIDTGPTTPGALIAIDANDAISGYQAAIATGPTPASVTVHPSGKFAYVVNQANNTAGNSISAYSINTTTGALSAIDANGAVSGTQASIATGTTPYAVTVDPTGKFAYVANGTDSNVSVYTINQTSGALTAGTAVSAGTVPISIAIDPTGQYAFVANNGSNTVSAYTITAGTGALVAVGGSPFTVNGLGSPTSPRSVAVAPTGKFVYVANAGNNSVSKFTITAGALSGESAVATGVLPFSVNVDPSGQFVYVANFTSNNVSTYTIGIGGALTVVGTGTATGAAPTSVTTTQ